MVGEELIGMDVKGKPIPGRMRYDLMAQPIGKESGRELQMITGYKTGYVTIDGKRIPVWSAETTFGVRMPEGIITKGFPVVGVGKQPYTKPFMYELGGLKAPGISREMWTWRMGYPITKGFAPLPDLLKTGDTKPFIEAMGDFVPKGKPIILPSGIAEKEYVSTLSELRTSGASVGKESAGITSGISKIKHWMPVLETGGGIGKYEPTIVPTGGTSAISSLLPPHPVGKYPFTALTFPSIDLDIRSLL